MKSLFYLIVVGVFLLSSCEKEDAVQYVENKNLIASISLAEALFTWQTQEIEVIIQKGTPCQYIGEIENTISGFTFSYNFILEGMDDPCITVTAEEVATVTFDPFESGQYTLNFLINGELFETRSVLVSEESVNTVLEGQWTVVSFEDYETSTSITKSEANTWSEYNNGDITVNFEFTDDLSGKISGKNVTNHFEGNLQLGPENEIIIDNLHFTEMNEPEWARMFHEISLAESYGLDHNFLTIYYNNKQNGVVLERSE